MPTSDLARDRELASGQVSGPEARGNVRVLATPDGGRSLVVSEFWLAPGAPDVRIYVSSRDDGAMDESATELGVVADGLAHQRWAFPEHLSPTAATSVIVFCHVYSVYFGHAVLRWREPGLPRSEP